MLVLINPLNVGPKLSAQIIIHDLIIWHQLYLFSTVLLHNLHALYSLYTRMSIFLAPILNFVLFHCQLCLNINNEIVQNSKSEPKNSLSCVPVTNGRPDFKAKKQAEKHNTAKNDNPLWKLKHSFRIRTASFKDSQKQTCTPLDHLVTHVMSNLPSSPLLGHTLQTTCNPQGIFSLGYIYIRPKNYFSTPRQVSPTPPITFPLPFTYSL